MRQLFEKTGKVNDYRIYNGPLQTPQEISFIDCFLFETMIDRNERCFEWPLLYWRKRNTIRFETLQSSLGVSYDLGIITFLHRVEKVKQT